MSARLAHRLDGPADAPVLVLGPSLGTTLGLWEPLLPALTGSRRVLRYDLRGHGGSEVIPGPATVDDLAGDLTALLDRLEIRRFAIGGVSLGGAVATVMALSAPERVSGLVLCCTSARFGEPGPWLERARQVRTEGMERLAGTAVERWFTPGFAVRHPDRVHPVVNMLRTTDPEGYAACCTALARYDVRDRLAGVRAPALVIAGAEDPVTTPGHARELAHGLGAGAVTIVDDASHLAPYERPEPVAQAMLGHLEGLE
ncbi:3-oxoadipate enol-lactonase [Actinomadura scrupuli]|uniref:3-oxoadipate enol-lactonase n=1 Tax=Actinomadura scrupuli TaxID=559629 RepID=UPI003D981812